MIKAKDKKKVLRVIDKLKENTFQSSRVNIRMPYELKSKVDMIAKQNNVDTSTFIRVAMEDFVSTYSEYQDQ